MSFVLAMPPYIDEIDDGTRHNKAERNEAKLENQSVQYWFAESDMLFVPPQGERLFRRHIHTALQYRIKIVLSRIQRRTTSDNRPDSPDGPNRRSTCAATKPHWHAMVSQYDGL